jgi:hypothetical protein
MFPLMKPLSMLLGFAVAAIVAQDVPPFQEYRGVRLGADRADVVKKLGGPSRGGTPEVFVISQTQTVKVLFASANKVKGMTIEYVRDANPPTPKMILGEEITARPDGSTYKLVRYPKASCWVSYSSTAGDTPIITVTINKTD